jgi:hypothetical protein
MENEIKNKLNIIGTGYLKTSKSGGEIISFLPDVPITAYLDDLLFILTVPFDSNSAPAYCRLQDKSRMDNVEKEEVPFEEIKAVGYCRTKQNTIIVCVPEIHCKVNLDEIVVIGTIPFDNKKTAPFYIKKKVYDNKKQDSIPPKEEVDLAFKLLENFNDKIKNHPLNKVEGVCYPKGSPVFYLK